MDQQRKNDQQGESRRVAELEGEVAQLRRELAARPGPDGGAPAPALSDGGFRSSRAKMVLVGVAIALLALATITVIFSALSSGFSSFADKAAKIFVPEGDEAAAPPAPDEDLPQDEVAPAEEPLPRAPGL